MSAVDKEAAFETADHKPASYAPSLTSKQRPIDCGGSDGLNNIPTGGYYQNVTQKGKLILPTAIWILIVVGGICFLGLLSSLNKTMSTLDTLVEIEQANAKLNKETQHNHNNHHHDHRVAPPSGKKVSSDNEEMMSPEELSNWLAFPSWASLERRPPPPSSARSARSDEEEGFKSLIDQVLRSTGLNPADGPISGKIAVIGIGDPSEAKEEKRMLDSMMDDLIMANSGLQASDFNEPTRAKVESSPKEQPQSTGGTVITANIDKLNININAPPTQEPTEEHHEFEPPRRKGKKIHPFRLGSQKNHEQIGSLDQSIDSLVDNLMNSPQFGDSQKEPSSELAELLFPLPVNHPAPYMMHFNHLGPHQAGSRPHQMLRHHRFHSRLHRPSPISPFPNLLIPINPMPQPHSPLDSSIPPMFGRPQMSRLVITVGDEAGKPTETNEHLTSTLKPVQGGQPESNPVNSPLDFDLTPQAPQPPRLRLDSSKEVPIFGVQNNNELGSLADSLIQAMQNAQREGSSGSPKDNVESLVFINGEPLVSDKQLSQSMDEDLKRDKSGKLHNHVNDLFQLFFGPPPDSKLVVAPQISPPKFMEIKHTPPQGDKKENVSELFGELKSEPKADKQQEGGPDKNEGLESKDGVPPDVEHLVDNLLGSMFALPQMGSAQEPVKIDPESSVVKGK